MKKSRNHQKRWKRSIYVPVISSYNHCHPTEGDELLEIDDTSSDKFEVGALMLRLEQNGQVAQDEDSLVMPVISDDSME
jgi:hypothetical protein